MDINNSSFWHNISNLYKDMQGNEASPENNNSHPGTQGQPHNDFDDSLVFQLFDSSDIDHDSFSKQVIDFFEENYQGYNWQDSYPTNEDASPQTEKPQENTRSQGPSSPIASGNKTASVSPDNSYISAMAEIAGVSFGEAANITKRHDFNNPRISMDKMLNILRDDFKLNATKATTDGWSSLPDIALVEIKAPEKDHKNHAVVVKRHDNNQQYFYDSRFPEPMEKSHQKLINAEYIGIQPGQHSPKDSAPLSTPTQETPKQEAPTPEAPKSNASASTHEVNKPRSRQHKNYVSVIAEMAGVSHEQAAKVAQNYKRSSQGMSMNRILKALREGLHINAARMTASNFSKLADVALVEIEGSKNGKDHHLAIVRRHKNGQQYIHDKPNSDAIKVSDQKLLSQEYIGLKPSQRKHTKQANTEGIDNNNGTPTKTTQGNSSRKINKVINFAEPMPPKGHIAAVAEMAGVSYERAERVAARYGMSGQDMEMNTMLKTLRDGFKMDVAKMSAANWSELPDVAIVDIIAPEEESKTHSVVARRNSSGEHFLYDNRVAEPVKLSDQKLAMEDCIGIQAKKQQSNHQASLSAPVSNAAQQKAIPQKSFIAALAEMTNVNYNTAERMASHYGQTDQNMHMDTIFKTLKDGFKMNVAKMNVNSWSALPDIAVVDIIAPEEKSKTHSVVARRLASGQQYIYDNRFAGPVKLTDQKLASGDCVGNQLYDNLKSGSQKTINKDPINTPSSSIHNNTSNAPAKQPSNAAAVIAEMTRVSPEKAEAISAEFKLNDQNKNIDGLLKTLREVFNMKAEKMNAKDFADLTDTALVELKGKDNSSQLAVIRRHTDGQQYIYNNQSAEPKQLSNEQMQNSAYIGIKPYDKAAAGKQKATGDDLSPTPQPRRPLSTRRTISIQEPNDMPPPLNPSIRQFTQSPKISKPPITPPPQTKASSPKVQESPKSNTSNQFGLGNIAFKQSGLTIDGIVKMLQGNEKCDVQRGRTSNWSELPDLAIVEIEAPEKESKTHSVVARRLPNGEHYLYDKRFPEPVKLSDQKLTNTDYIGLKMKGQQANQQIPNSQLKMSARSAQAPQKTDTIATIAEMAEVSHSRASAMAKHFSSTPKKMTMDEMFNTLKDGFNLNLTTQSTDNWSSLPDVALVEVKGEQGNNYPAVARRNPDGEQFLYASHLSGPQKVDRQTLAGSHYIALQADDSPAAADFPASPVNSVASDINPQAAFQVANIAMIAEIADVSYERAESMASHFSANEDNMTMDELFNTLKDGFNLNVTTDSSDNWSSLPDIALVEIRDARNDNYKAVVRRDPDGEQYIYANHFSAPKKLSDQILTGSSYIGINIEEPANDDFSLPQINSSLYNSSVLSQYPNIAALAEIADVSYDRAEVMASYFTADKSNMTMDQIVTTLNDGFNLNVSRQRASDWSSLPDVALVKISDANNYNDEHLVVVRRGPDNKQYIYDSRLDSPKELSDEQLVSGDCISTQAEKVHKELRVVHNHPDVRNDCAVCAIAVATGDSYENALSASRKNGFVETGFSQDSTLKTVKDLGHSAVLQTSNGFNLTWSELPDLAIISVLDRDVEDTENADHHAVVFQRQEDGEGLIYDSNRYQTTSPSDYKFAKNTYIKIS